jgi:hypothetical protein
MVIMAVAHMGQPAIAQMWTCGRKGKMNNNEKNITEAKHTTACDDE